MPPVGARGMTKYINLYVNTLERNQARS
jgi:hypothetical protein